jgi:chromosome partitioning protein
LAGNWNEYGLPLMATAIANRVSYAQSLSDGLSVFDTTDQAAKLEIDALITELETKGWL